MKQIVIETIETHRKLLAEFQADCIETVIAAARMLIDCIKKDGCIYLCGNGGSAADAQHIAAELVVRFMKNRKAFPAVALTTDTSILTSVANDYGFDNIFARQVEALIKPGDVLWAFSTSGASANVIAAAQSAKQKKASVLAFTGKGDTELGQIADLCLAIDAPNTPAAQEIHQLAYHTICDLIERQLS